MNCRHEPKNITRTTDEFGVFSSGLCECGASFSSHEALLYARTKALLEELTRQADIIRCLSKAVVWLVKIIVDHLVSHMNPKRWLKFAIEVDLMKDASGVRKGLKHVLDTLEEAE